MAGEGEEVGPLLLCVRFHLLLRVGVVGPCVVLLVVAAAAKGWKMGAIREELLG